MVYLLVNSWCVCVRVCVCVCVCVCVRQVYWKSPNETPEKYVEGPKLFGGQEERKVKKEAGI